MEIFANHAHLWPEGTYQGIKGGLVNLLRIMDKCGISKAVVFAPLDGELGDSGDRKRNEWLLNEIKEHRDRLVPFANIAVTHPLAHQEARWAAESGFKGIKLHPSASKFNILDERATGFYEEAQKQKLILDFHTGVHCDNRIKDFHPLNFDELSYMFPDLTMIFEHVGGFCFFYDMLAVLQNGKKPGGENNLYAGLTSILSRNRQKEWYLGPEKIGELIWQLGVDQLIYGLDFPWNQEEHIMQDFAIFDRMDISAVDKEKIFGGNLRKLLFSGK